MTRPSILVFSNLLLVICLFAALGVSCQQNDTRSQSQTALKVDSLASADGLMIEYQVQGAGDRTLFFVHCWCCDRSYFEEQIEAFADDYRIVALDLAGHGGSASGREQWTMQAFGADVAAVANKLDLKQIILIGHSMGGTVCIEAARLLPERVVAIVGIDNLQNLKSKFTKEQIDGFLAAFRADFSGTTDQFVRGMFPEGTDSLLVELIAADMAGAPSDVAIGAFENLFAYDYTAALEDVRVPIRTICSDKYPVDIEGNKLIAASFETKIMPGTGHFLHMTNSAEFNKLLRETIEEFWPANSSGD